MIKDGKLLGGIFPFLVSPFGANFTVIFISVCIILLLPILSQSFSMVGFHNEGTHFNIQLTKQKQNDYLAFAQNSSSSNETQVIDNLLAYENSTYGIKISYPSGWDYYESGEYGGFLDIAVFQSPLEGRTDLSSATVSVSVDTLANKNQSLEEYFDKLIPSVQESMAPFNYEILESKVNDGVTLAGKPAYQTLSTNTQDNMNFKTLEMGTIANGKAYVITYNAEVDEYPNHLPLVQEMINSFQLSPSTSAAEIQQKQQENTIIGENATLANNVTVTPTTMTVTNQTAVTSSSSFINYENSTYGIRMQYPSDWEKQEDVAGGSVHFLSPLENETDMFREGLGIIVQGIPSANTLDNFTDTSLSSLQQAAPSLQIINSSQTTLANSIPAEIVEFTWVNPQDNNQMKTMETYAIADGKSYIISYGALASKYDLYLTTILHMLDSFEILPLG